MDRFGKALGLVLVIFVAGCASGGFGERPKLDNLTDNGPPRDEVAISFKISDADHTRSHVVVEYHDGVDWQAATLTDTTKGSISGNVVRGLKPTAAGITVDISWDTWEDEVQTDGPGTVNLRLSAFDADGAGEVETLGVSVDNKLAVLRTVETEVVFEKEDAGVVGYKDPDPQTLQIWNDGPAGTTLNWRVDGVTYHETAYEGWLTSPQQNDSGSVLDTDPPFPILFEAATVIGSVPKGTYHATVEIEDPNAHESPVQIPVTLTVRDPMPAITLSETELVFTFDETPPSPQTFTVSNGGEGTAGLSWSLTDDVSSPDWLYYAPASGEGLAPTDPAVTVTVSIVDPQVLTSGEHVGRITVSGYGTGTGAPTSTGDQTVTVRLSVAIPPTIVYGPGSFTFEGVYGSADPDPQTLYISNSGVQTLNWTVTVQYEGSHTGWVTLSPTSDSCTSETDEVTVGVQLAGLDAGTYSATVVITDTNAQNSPQLIPVTLVIHEF